MKLLIKVRFRNIWKFKLKNNHSSVSNFIIMHLLNDENLIKWIVFFSYACTWCIKSFHKIFFLYCDEANKVEWCDENYFKI